jgi:hypothetical protein
VEETGVPCENDSSVASHWQTLSHIVYIAGKIQYAYIVSKRPAFLSVSKASTNSLEKW